MSELEHDIVVKHELEHETFGRERWILYLDFGNGRWQAHEWNGEPGYGEVMNIVAFAKKSVEHYLRSR